MSGYDIYLLFNFKISYGFERLFVKTNEHW